MFKALLLERADGGSTRATLTGIDEARLQAQLPDGDVHVDVAWSSLNYKDALAVTGRGAIVRNWPLVPGIDLAGTVSRSGHAAWNPGDQVIVNGWGIGELHWGGFGEKAIVSSEWLQRLPGAYSARQAMAIGTAGYTAALCVMALQRHGLKPGDGPVLVTGAAGGVGSVAIVLLAALGFEVAASTGRPEQAGYLQGLGAKTIVDRNTLSGPGKPLQREQWAGVVDAVGSHTLVNACAQTRLNGAVAACGLAQGADFHGTVMPFILRGVTLYGINCVYVDAAKRGRAWDLLAAHLTGEQLDAMTSEVALSDIVTVSQQMLDHGLRGRTVVDVHR